MDIVTLSALLATIILLSLSLFQLALVFGAPIGKFAWGGQNTVLPSKLRMSSAVSIFIYIIFALFILSKAGLIDFIQNETLLSVGMWVMTAYFVFGIVLNAMSRSKAEKYTMTPIVLCLAVTFYIVALLG